jgi:hypothetical protein
VKTLFLAQNPKLPSNVDSPLDGTASGRTVRAWLRILGLAPSDVLILNASKKLGKVCATDYDIAGVSLALKECTRFVALGAYAQGLLERLGVPCFVLPHPSGLNRRLNDREELQSQLALCRLYVKGG